MRRFLLLPLLLLAFAGCQKDRSPGGGTPGTATPLCGNGQLDLGESCDTAAIGATACPTSCDDGVSCTTDTLTGSGCRVACENTAITSCQGGDGCCANGCTNSTDVDCSATCGDNVVDQGETCDGDCMPCESPDACTVATQYGSAATCNVECAYTTTAVCGAADSCCPPGCTNVTDEDCSDTCGNGTVEQGETCDGNCPTDCPSTSCETSMLVGSAMACTSTCTFSLITMCTAGDSCCPEGCEGMDDDCQAPQGGVGSPCTDNTVCQTLLNDTNASCIPAPTFPEGYCTVGCTNTAACPTGSACWIESNVCIQICGSGLPQCRTGYACTQQLDTLENPFMGCFPSIE